MRGTRLTLIAVLAAVAFGLPQAAGASPAAGPRHGMAGESQGSPLAVAPVGGSPAFAAENYRTRTLYVPNSGDGTVSVVNLTACTALNVSRCARKSPVIRVGNLPLGIAVDQATNTVYVANAIDNTVSVINGATCDARDTSGCGQKPVTVSVGSFGDAVAVNPVTNTVFITNQNAHPGTVSVIDGNSCNGSHPLGCAHQPMATPAVGGGPSGIDVNPVTNTIYVANFGKDSNGNNVPHGNTLSVIDGATCHAGDTAGCTPVGTVRAGVSPAGVAADPANNTVYVSDTYDARIQFPPSGPGAPSHEGSVTVVNGSTCDASNPSGCASQKPPRLTVGRDPIGLAVDATNHSIYVTNALDDTVSVINAATCNWTHSAGCLDRPPLIAVGGAPSWPVVDAAQHTVYVADAADNNVLVLSDRSCDAQTSAGCRRPTGTVVAGTTPSAAAIDERFHTVYVGDSNRFEPPYTISMINTATCNAADKSACTRRPGSLPADGTPFSIAVNQRTGTIYVASSGPLQVIDAATCNANTSDGCDHTATVPAGGYAAAVDPSTDTIYAANVHHSGSGYISVIDGRHCHAGDISGCAGQTITTTPRVAVGHFPGGIAVDPADHTVYVTNLADGTVSVIDTTHCHAGDTSDCATQSPPTIKLPNANGPIAIAVDPTTNTAYATEGFPFTPGAVALINTTHCHAGDTSQCSTQTPTTIPVPPGPVSVQIDPTTHDIYLADRYDSTVSVINGLHCNATDASHCNPIAKIEVGSNPANVTLDLQSQTVYVPNFYDNDASMFPVAESR